VKAASRDGAREDAEPVVGRGALGASSKELGGAQASMLV
jgi:hypothetical protein